MTGYSNTLQTTTSTLSLNDIKRAHVEFYADHERIILVNTQGRVVGMLKGPKVEGWKNRVPAHIKKLADELGMD